MSSSAQEMATFAGGCFWCVEAVFEQIQGVQKVVSGYANGVIENPSYEQVCTGRTGHAEVVQVTFDPEVVSYGELVEIFFAVHDPTTLNRQGGDVGTQYRSGIYVHSPEQEAIARQKMGDLAETNVWGAPLVTEIEPLKSFYPAEDYHQGYFRAHPEQSYCAAVVSPKVAKFRQKFAHRLRTV